MQGKWIESDKGKHAFYVEGVNENRRASAIIFYESGISYTYSLNFSRCVDTGALEARTLEEAKKEVESILYAKLHAPLNSITLYYHLEYYILVFNNKNVVIDNHHIQACPPEKFRDERIEKLKKIKDITEIWQCYGSILAEMVKTVIYREDTNISTIYEAVGYSGRMVWKKENTTMIKKWIEIASGKYELHLNIERNNPMAVIKDYRLYSPSIWKTKMLETPKSFVYDFQQDYDVRLYSENLYEAKKEVESIIVKKCKDFIHTIPEQHRKLDELEKYYKNIIDKITVVQ